MISLFSYSIVTTNSVKRFLIGYLLFFSILISHSQNKIKSIEVKSEKYIKVNHANRLLFDKESGIDAQRLIGSVECEHEGSKMYCDSAYLYNNKKLEAFGHILITKGDSIFVYGDSLKYDANTKLANLKGHVRCVEKDMTLTTSILVYDLSTSIASYYNGGTIVNKDNTLISKNGHYYSASKELSFHYDVVLKNTNIIMKSDTLRYNTLSKIAYFFGPSIITSKENYIYCENGWYDTGKEVARFSKHAMINTKSQKLFGDSLFYNRKTGYGRAMRHVKIIDTSNTSIIIGDFAEHYELTKKSIVTGHAVYSKKIEKDTLFLSADTLFYNKSDSLHANVKAYQHVKIFKSDLQGICDSLNYSMHDSVLILSNSPVLWASHSQITAKQINVFISEFGLKSFELLNNALVIQKSDSLDEQKFNQVSGKNMEGFFVRDTIRKINIKGNAQVIYYVKQKNSYTGVNKTLCQSITMSFDVNGLSKMSFKNKPESIIYPLKEVIDEDMRLKNFIWLEHKRPKYKMDILNK